MLVGTSKLSYVYVDVIAKLEIYVVIEQTGLKIIVNLNLFEIFTQNYIVSMSCYTNNLKEPSHVTQSSYKKRFPSFKQSS